MKPIETAACQKQEDTVNFDTIDYKNKVFLLDIDGTLNNSQECLSDEMRRQLQRLTRYFQVYFVTGNPYTKTVDIIDGSIAHFSGVFCNNADELRTMRGKIMWSDTETAPLPVRIEDTLRHLLGIKGSDHLGNRIEWRNPRMLNFSHIGRFASHDMRKAHDASWRHETIDFLKIGYPGVEAVAGGSISLDIYATGADKSRACEYINKQGKEFIFIGDKTSCGGNDYPVKEYCETKTKNICIQSNGPEHTMKMIDKILGRI